MKRSVDKGFVWIVIVVFVVAIPFAVMLLAGLTPPASWPTVSGGTVKEQTWISFAGAYIGSIIGALGAIIIMFRTLAEGKKDKLDNS